MEATTIAKCVRSKSANPYSIFLISSTPHRLFFFIIFFLLVLYCIALVCLHTNVDFSLNSTYDGIFLLFTLAFSSRAQTHRHYIGSCNIQIYTQTNNNSRRHNRLPKCICCHRISIIFCFFPH